MKILILFLLISISSFAEISPNNEKLEKDTKTTLMIIKKKLIIFKLKNGKLPASLLELKVKATDGWGRKLIYKLNKDKFHGYELYSLGNDGKKSKDDIHYQ